MQNTFCQRALKEAGNISKSIQNCSFIANEKNRDRGWHNKKRWVLMIRECPNKIKFSHQFLNYVEIKR